ncbi:MAG: NUDIX hydrolase [Bacillota bacterium]
MRDLRQRQLSSELLYQGRVVSLHRDQVAMPDGQVVERVVVEHHGAVGVVPMTDDGQVILVRQWRYATGGALLEIPAGGLEPGEDPELAAARELQEEIGYRPGKLVKLGEFFTAPGFCSELLHLYLATELQPSHLPGDDDEDIEVVRIPLVELATHLGELRDAKTLVGLLMAQRMMA